MGKRSSQKDERQGDDPIIAAISDLFIATLFSETKKRTILLGVINAVLKNSCPIPIKAAKVLNGIS
jgi:hypothetical protein